MITFAFIVSFGGNAMNKILLVSLFIFAPKQLIDQNQSVAKDQTFFENRLEGL